MLSLPCSIRIFVATDPVDFRKAHDGLVAVVRASPPSIAVSHDASTFSHIGDDHRQGGHQQASSAALAVGLEVEVVFGDFIGHPSWTSLAW